MLSLKVLNDNMESCSGGKLKWEKGKKYTVRGKLKLCQKGLHLTTFPEEWQGSRVFIAEASLPIETDVKKSVHRAVKLLKELSK